MPTIEREFGEKLLTCFDDPQKFGVHLLFNEWWEQAPAETIAVYEADFLAVPDQRVFVEESYWAPSYTLDDLAKYKSGTVGRAYHDFIADNNLEANLATNYMMLHDMMTQSGKLDRMPEGLRYAIIRGFQLHDLLHVLTGYEATGPGEIALQAFCLAQIRFPYFGMWMSVVTTRMTLLDPDSIQPMMTSITDGWQYGQRAKNIQFGKWEEMFDRPLDEVRRENGLIREEPFALAA